MKSENNNSQFSTSHSKLFNPDVLSCLANLSNDEVFTPPKLANEILDLLPQDLWTNKNATFLDPCSKTGVFLREIAKRLLRGLEKEIPDLHRRINHIFKNQIFGLAITELTAHLTRRSVYCSKHAMGKYSVCNAFDDDSGNIRYNRTEHTWKDGKCVFCGANQDNYDRGGELETHAYEFIHAEVENGEWKVDNEEWRKMKFDVIVGNPPYQLKDGGFGDSAVPIYHKFIQQAKKLNPRYLSMIVPARWYSGGKGLDEFRDEMLNDSRFSEIHDFPETKDCFPGLNIRGGVCYFLWDITHEGDCKISTHKGNVITSIIERPLLEPETDIFVRYNEAIPILHKVRKLQEETFEKIVSSRKPFGLATNFSDYKKELSDSYPIKLYRFGEIGYIKEGQIIKSDDLLQMYKIFIAKASPGGDYYPHQVFSKPILGEPNTCCTETYVVIGPFKDKKTAQNVIQYISTRFFRFMVLLIKNTQDVPKKVYSFVPMQDFSEPWTDEKLYAKYGITAEEQAFIESMIRPMEVTEGENV
jgi:site-specific DNA-methyltransferase (adenine-specific)